MPELATDDDQVGLLTDDPSRSTGMPADWCLQIRSQLQARTTLGQSRVNPIMYVKDGGNSLVPFGRLTIWQAYHSGVLAGRLAFA